MRIITMMLLCFLAAQANANVVKDCLPGSSVEASHACDTFIEGFIAGALLTDAAIVDSFNQSEEGSSFVTRAYRTRLGQSETPPTFFASFCLSEETTEVIIRQIRADMVDLNPKEPLGDVVYRLLKARYPCD